MNSDSKEKSIVYVAIPAAADDGGLPSAPAVFAPIAVPVKETAATEGKAPAKERDGAAPQARPRRGGRVLAVAGIVAASFLVATLLACGARHSLHGRPHLRGRHGRHHGGHRGDGHRGDWHHDHGHGHDHGDFHNHGDFHQDHGHGHHGEGHHGMGGMGHDHGMGHHDHGMGGMGHHGHGGRHHPWGGADFDAVSSSSEDQWDDGMDGWLAGNESHDAWLATIADDEIDTDFEMLENGEFEVERLAEEKEDGMIPGLP